MRRFSIAVLAIAFAATSALPVPSFAAPTSSLGYQFAAQMRAALGANAVLGGGKIAHVIVIVQENRSVDNLFQGFPGADTVSAGLNGGTLKQLVPFPLQYALDPDHSHTGFVSDFDGDLLDGFDHEYAKQSCYGASPQCTAYAYVRHEDSAIYFSLAKQYALADHVMQINEGPSFANHIHLVAAQGGYPIAVAGNEVIGTHGPGCMSPSDSKVLGIDMRATFPNGLLPNPIPACRSLQTVFGLLDARSVSWRYYTPTLTLLHAGSLDLWTPPIYIEQLYSKDLAHVRTPETSILTDIANRSLPAVSYTAPTFSESDHPHQPAKGEDPQAGPHWVSSIVNSIETSPVYRDNTVILVTWDDWGGWYDHYKPTATGTPFSFGYGVTPNQYGFRTPLLVISPYVINRVDHTERSQASIIRFIEAVFGLPSLGVLDGRTDDLATMFDFTAAPRAFRPVAAPVPVDWFRGANIDPFHSDPDE